MATTADALSQLLMNVFDEYQSHDDPAVQAEGRRQFVLHMTDWLDDFASMRELFDDPERVTTDEAGRRVAAFLYHAVPHLNEACRLMLDDVLSPWEQSKTDG